MNVGLPAQYAALCLKAVTQPGLPACHPSASQAVYDGVVVRLHIKHLDKEGYRYLVLKPLDVVSFELAEPELLSEPPVEKKKELPVEETDPLAGE